MGLSVFSAQEKSNFDRPPVENHACSKSLHDRRVTPL